MALSRTLLGALLVALLTLLMTGVPSADAGRLWWRKGERQRSSARLPAHPALFSLALTSTSSLSHSTSSLCFHTGRALTQAIHKPPTAHPPIVAAPAKAAPVAAAAVAAKPEVVVADEEEEVDICLIALLFNLLYNIIMSKQRINLGL